MTNDNEGTPASVFDRTAMVVNYLLLAAIGVLTIYYVVTFCVVLKHLMSFPTLPSASERHIMAVYPLLAGKSMYSAITPESGFVIYFPLYFVVLAGWLRLAGISIPSIYVFQTFLIACQVILVGFVAWRVGKKKIAALCAGGVWIALQGFLSGHGLGVTPDTLLALLVLGGIAFLALGHGLRSLFFASVLFTCAGYTKQNMMPLALLPPFLCLFYHRSVRNVALVAVPFVVGLLTAFILNHATDGWFFVWTMGSPSHHRYVLGDWATNANAAFHVMAPSLVLLAAGCLPCDSKTLKRRVCVGPLLGGVYMAGIGYAGSLRMGGGVTHMLCLYITLIPLAVGVAFRATTAVQNPMRFANFVLAACVVHLLCLLYSPARLIPSQQVVAYADSFVKYVRSVNGPVFCARHPFLLKQVGKAPSVHRGSIHSIIYSGNVLRGPDGEIICDIEGLPRSVYQAISARRYEKIIYEFPTLGNCPLLRCIRKYYVKEGTWPGGETGFTITMQKEVYRRPTAEEILRQQPKTGS